MDITVYNLRAEAGRGTDGRGERRSKCRSGGGGDGHVRVSGERENKLCSVDKHW